MTGARGSKYERGKQAEPAGEGDFDLDTLIARHRRILDKMTTTVDELRAYVERYGQAVNAQRLSIILCEQIDLLGSLQPTDDPKGYLKDIKRVYGDSAELANTMSEWEEILRPEREGMSPQTRKLSRSFSAREKKVLILVKDHKEEHDRAKDHIKKLRKVQNLERLQELAENMHTNARKICNELHGGIEKLITEELKMRLEELKQAGD